MYWRNKLKSKPLIWICLPLWGSKAKDYRQICEQRLWGHSSTITNKRERILCFLEGIGCLGHTPHPAFWVIWQCDPARRETFVSKVSVYLLQDSIEWYSWRYHFVSCKQDESQRRKTQDLGMRVQRTGVPNFPFLMMVVQANLIYIGVQFKILFEKLGPNANCKQITLKHFSNNPVSPCI